LSPSFLHEHHFHRARRKTFCGLCDSIDMFHWCLPSRHPELPLSTPEGERGARPATPTKTGLLMDSGQRPHILLVEHDKDVLSTTTAMLERLGCNITAETEGLTALRVFSKEPDRFDSAILDHGTAGITGLELAQRFRRIRPGFPVVLSTGPRGRPSAEQLKAAGICLVILKPVKPKQLAAAVHKALGEWAKGKP
jgi:CheY-like chemotaxis protein